MRHRALRGAAACACGLLAIGRGGATTRLVSVSPTPVPYLSCGAPAPSADARFVVFHSEYPDLVPNDANGTFDVFRQDVRTGAVALVSAAPDGAPGNGPSLHPSVSADGRFAAFESLAGNLVSNDANGSFDVFRRDMETGVTLLVSAGMGGLPANGPSYAPILSADGRYVLFSSMASNLVPNDTNGAMDVFLRDTQAGTTSLVSVGFDGGPANGASFGTALTPDGHFAGFASDASNLVPGDANGLTDAFARELPSGATRRVSVGPGGCEGDGASGGPALSADGRYAAFASWAEDLDPQDANGARDIFINDARTGRTELASVPVAALPSRGAESSSDPSISADGRYVTFTTWSSRMVYGTSQWGRKVVRRDTLTDTTLLVSAATSGVGANGHSMEARLAPDGTAAAFVSVATNLFTGDTPGSWDVFVREGLSALPGPSLSAVTPLTLIRGAPQARIVVRGTSLPRSSVVRWDGQARPTIYRSSLEVWAILDAADTSEPGAHRVTVTTEAAGGFETNAVGATVLDARYGDVNGDGAVDGEDAAAALRMAGGLDRAGGTLAGDIAPFPGSGPEGYGDGRVDLQDAAALLRFLHR